MIQEVWRSLNKLLVEQNEDGTLQRQIEDGKSVDSLISTAKLRGSLRHTVSQPMRSAIHRNVAEAVRR